MTVQNAIEIGAAFFGSVGFGIIFGLRGKKLWLAAVGGGLTWALFLILKEQIGDDFSCGLVASVFAAIYAEVLARVLKAPATIFTMPAVIPLVPGGSLYRTMSGLVAGDQGVFAAQGEITVRMALSIALGIVLVAIAVNGLHRLLGRTKGEVHT